MRPWLARDLRDFGRTVLVASVCAASVLVAPHWLLQAFVLVPCAVAVSLGVSDVVHALRELVRIRRHEKDLESSDVVRSVHDS